MKTRLTVRQVALIKKYSTYAVRSLNRAKKARKEGNRASMRSWAHSYVNWQYLIYCVSNPV